MICRCYALLLRHYSAAVYRRVHTPMRMLCHASVEIAVADTRRRRHAADASAPYVAPLLLMMPCR